MKAVDEFSIELTDKKNSVFWFLVKKKYKVRVDANKNEAVCDCMGDTFRIGGKKQFECKHAIQCKRLVEVSKK